MANSNGWGDGSVNNDIGWGQGANNNIGWGKSHLNSWSGATDIDGGNPPVNSVAPALSGTAQEGQTLTCSTGTWSGSPTYTYQWKRNGNNITSATNSTYTLVTADVGTSIKCTVTATNFTGSATADSNTVTPTSSVDADAQAFITAASITDPTQQSAINQLVVDLKGYGIWTKMKALYPFVGGTSSTHKWNLKDPRDLDAAFRLVFSGGWTHSANGALPNGTNGYADTFLTPSTALSSQNSTHLSSYIRTASQGVLLGTDNTYRLWIAPNFNGSLKFFELNTVNATSRTPISTSTGFWLGNRPGSIDAKLFNQGVLNDNYSSQAWGLDNFKVFLAARNLSNAGSNYSSAQIAFSSIGDGLTDTEAANFYTAVQAFQVTLGRSIGTQTVSDADAQAFVTNAGIVDQVEANAINNLVIGLKADSLWTKMKALYPFVGGTSTTHKFNLKNPLDTNAAFRLVFAGGWTHSSTGALPNGTNAYADTSLIPNSVLTLNSTHISCYTRTNTTVFAPLLSSENAVVYTNGLFIWPKYSGNLFSVRINDNSSDAATAVTNTQGLHLATRTAANVKKYRHNNTQVLSNTTVSSALNTSSIYIGASRNNADYSTHQIAFASIGDGLTDTEATNFYNRVQTFNTALARQV